ncbi:MAG: Rrf2 family transcriptional regulator [Alphaproteobacteria bacterium]|jgi:Rrf2 family protein|nr:Rrf2 family transcriptional regulator [Alphaproteobacteria bacterium]
MFRISKKLLFAIEAVLDIAYNAGSEPVQSREITQRQGIPRRYLEQVMQQLVRTNILIGVRGPRGGYRLARERRRITVGDIVRVVRAMEKAPAPDEVDGGSELGQKVVRAVWAEAQDELMARFDSVTIEDLCVRARATGIASEAERKLDYTI